MLDRQPTIIFRHLGAEVAPDCEPNSNWQVELHTGRGFPIGLAWVLVPPPGAAVAADSRPQIKFVLVADDERRNGIASRLIEACRARWPTAELTLPISATGARLYRKFVPPPRAEDVFGEECVRRHLASGVSREELDRLARANHEQMIDQGIVRKTRKRPKPR